MLLKEEVSWLRQLLDNPHIGILVTGIDRKVLFVNDYLAEKTGYEKEELVGEDASIFHVSQEAYENFFKLAVQLVNQGKPVSIDYKAKHKDGHTIWITISGNLLHSEKEVLWSIIDITDRVEKEKEISRLKERMDIALAGYSAGVWEWNLQDNSVYASLHWKQMLGFGEELPSHIDSWKERVHPEDLDAIMQQIDAVVSKGESTIQNVHRLKHKSGKWIWVLARASVIYEKNGSIRLIGIHTDISEQKELELKYAHQAQIIEQVHDIVISTDLDGNILSWNKGAEKTLGYTQEEMLFKSISSIHIDKDYKKLQKGIEILKEQGEYHTERQLLKKNGDLIYADLSLSLLFDENKKAIGFVGYAQDITERKMVEQEIDKQKKRLQYLAHHDALTNLPNRLLFNDRLQVSIEKAKRNDMLLAVLFIDLDHFKEINDSFGHDIGDIVLKKVTKLFKERVRREDTLARLGGDEFALIMENLKSPEDAAILAQNIIDIFTKPLVFEEYSFYLSCSIGISLYPADGSNAKNLLKYADAAMYKAKENGRNGYAFYEEKMTQAALKKVVIETELRNALKNEELVVYFQQQMHAVAECLIGMEALVRWEHPEVGLITPDRFLNIAESSGLIVEIDRYVIKKSIEQFVSWYAQGLNPGVLALNISVAQLAKKDFVSFVETVLKQSGCKAEWLEFEITESGLMKNFTVAIDTLQKLSDLGIEIAVDDFGTGYSSLAYLKKLPINRLKIDKSFVDDLPDDEEDVAITRAIIALAKSLNLRVIAEGVESAAQKEFLIANGCEKIQGYLYGRPMSVSDMETLLLKIK